MDSMMSSAEVEIFKMINKHMILLQTLKVNGDNHGMIIVVLNTDFISNSFQYADDTQTIGVLDEKENIIWSSKNMGKYMNIVQNIEFASGRSEIKKIENQRVLTTHSMIQPYGLQIINMTRVQDIIRDSVQIRVFIIRFGMICMLGVFLISLLYSRKISAPLISIAKQPSDMHVEKVGKEIDRQYIIKNKRSLGYRLVLYFVVSTMIPNPLMITISLNKYYEYYKKVHPMKGDVDLLGAYFDDHGINLMHDEWFSPMSETTAALLKLAHDEGPDMAVNLHSCENSPEILETRYIPFSTKVQILEISRKYIMNLTKDGYRSFKATDITEDGPIGKVPPTFNLDSAIYHAGVSIPFLF